jgi:hypothetical protein
MHKRKILTKLKTYLKKLFYFNETINQLVLYDTSEDIIKAQVKNKNIKDITADFLSSIKYNKGWVMPYSVIVVTMDEDEYIDLLNQKINCFLLKSKFELEQLSTYDVILTNENIDLPQAIPFNIEFPEKSLKELSKYLLVIDLLFENLSVCKKVDNNIQTILSSLKNAQKYLDVPKAVTREDVEHECEILNEKLSKSFSKFSGEEVLNFVYKKNLDKRFDEEIQNIIENSKYSNLFNSTVPIKINEQALENHLRHDSVSIFSDHAYKIQNDKNLHNLNKNLKYLKDFLIKLDLSQGISRYRNLGATNFPEIRDELKLKNAVNLLIKNAKPISFNLNKDNRCSFLTGANSGGKTTLLEHIIQLNFLLRMGLPTIGNVTLPLFEIEYLAKTKGSISKGAFETLLSQFATVKPNTLILADEIESVTEPGVAADVICATAQYCIKKGCYSIFATHLGKDLVKRQPKQTRIDGIEAKGLDEKNNLIIDHNPVLGRLAASTPELIIKRLGNLDDEYYQYLAKNVSLKT